MYNVGGTWPLYVAGLRYLSLLNTNCNVTGYWWHRSICYTPLFTTPLVVTTVSVYNELWPSDVVSRSGPFDFFGYLFGDLSSICVFFSVSLLSLSLFSLSVFISVSLLSLSLFSLSAFISVSSIYLSSLCLYLGVSSISVCLCVFRPSNRVFSSGIEDTFPYDCIFRCSGFSTIWLLRNS
jgi:hypothetical protein